MADSRFVDVPRPDAAAALPVRRTQQQRRDATVSRLLEATVATISELGYARATVQSICARAGISQGALFKQFDSKAALLAAAATEVGHRLRAEFVDRAAELAAGTDDPVLAGLRIARDLIGGELNAVWLELFTASRTDSALRDVVSSAFVEHIKGFLPIGTGGADADGGKDVVAAVSVALNSLQGMAVSSFVLAEDDLQERQLQVLADLIRSYLGA